MKMTRVNIAIAVLGALSALQVVRAQEDEGLEAAEEVYTHTRYLHVSRAHVVVYKSVSAPESQDYLVQDMPFLVTYSAINMGEAPATNLTVRDDWPAETFTVREGDSNIALAVLPPGGNHTWSVTLIPRVTGTMTCARAAVEYKFVEVLVEGEPAEDVAVAAASSTPGRMDIMSPAAYARIAASINSNYVTAAVVMCAAIALAPVALAVRARGAIAASQTRRKKD